MCCLYTELQVYPTRVTCLPACLHVCCHADFAKTGDPTFLGKV